MAAAAIVLLVEKSVFGSSGQLSIDVSLCSDCISFRLNSNYTAIGLQHTEVA